MKGGYDSPEDPRYNRRDTHRVTGREKMRPPLPLRSVARPRFAASGVSCSHLIKAAIARGLHLFPSRTEKLNLATSMILRKRESR